MKNFMFQSIKMLMMAVATSVAFSSCDTDEDVDNYEVGISQKSEPTGLSVDKKDLNFPPEKNVTRTIRIECAGDWEIKNIPNWLRASSTKGTNSTSVDFTTTSPNNSSSTLEDSFDVLLLTTGETRSITVCQDGSAIAACQVRPNLITALSNGIAFDLTCDRKVARYYRGYIKASRAGVMSDDEIINELERNFTRHLPDEDEVANFSDLAADTRYIIYTLGYDKNGNRGDLTATEVSTLPKKSNEPTGWINDMSYDASNWYWTTKKSATCTGYYMMSTEDPEIAAVSDVLQAWWIDYAIQCNDIPEYVNGSSWRQTRNGSMLAVWTRGVDSYGSLSGQIDWNYVTANATRSAVNNFVKKNALLDHSGKKLSPGQYRLFIAQ